MKKGHGARFHRHRNHNPAIEWEIRDSVGNVVDKGRGRTELGYALTGVLKNLDKMVIEIER